MTSLEVFLCGCAGSIALDVTALARHIQTTRKRRLPHYYYSFGYYVVRSLIACMAGGLALAYGIQQPLLAINIGAAAPMLIVAFSQGVGGAATHLPKE